MVMIFDATMKRHSAPVGEFLESDGSLLPCGCGKTEITGRVCALTSSVSALIDGLVVGSGKKCKTA